MDSLIRSWRPFFYKPLLSPQNTEWDKSKLRTARVVNKFFRNFQKALLSNEGDVAVANGVKWCIIFPT